MHTTNNLALNFTWCLLHFCLKHIPSADGLPASWIINLHSVISVTFALLINRWPNWQQGKNSDSARKVKAIVGEGTVILLKITHYANSLVLLLRLRSTMASRHWRRD